MTDELKLYLATERYYAGVGYYLATNLGVDKTSLNIPSPLRILSDLSDCSFDELSMCIASLPTKSITQTSIPQFNSIRGGSYGLLELLLENGDYGLSYSSIGERTKEVVKNTDTAHEKYGQLHSALAHGLDLVYLVRIDGRKHVYISDLGYAMLKFSEEEKRILCAKLMMNIPIIAYLLKIAVNGSASLSEIIGQFINKGTTERRIYTVQKLLNEIQECAKCDIPLISRICE